MRTLNPMSWRKREEKIPQMGKTPWNKFLPVSSRSDVRIAVNAVIDFAEMFAAYCEEIRT